MSKKSSQITEQHDEKQSASSPHADPKQNQKDISMTQSSQTASTTEPQVIVKKTGSALGLLALLVALGLGGAGYYFGQQQVQEISEKLTALSTQTTTATMQSLEMERAQLAQLFAQMEENKARFAYLDQQVNSDAQMIAQLKQQIVQLASQTKAVQPNEWLLSEADFLLNNALRKLVLDDDIETSIMLLKLSDEVLAKVSDSKVNGVRNAINTDLKRLLSLDRIDQNAIMQRLSELANGVDELAVLNANFDTPDTDADKLSDSLDDWQENAKKSAVNFLNHFIKIKSKQTDTTALLAPNQDIYLRENIRLRLQIAILAVPRQQDELYKQSLETVASWIRTYFDTRTDIAKDYLKNLDELAAQSIYVNAPDQLSSLTELDKLLNRQPKEMQKIELNAEKSLTESTQNEKKSVKPTAPNALATESNSTNQSVTPAKPQ